MTGPLYVSLARYENQRIPSGRYTLLSFPSTSRDAYSMAGGERDVILPHAEGLACLELNVIWDDVYQPEEFRDVFVRDPRGRDDRTGYDHRSATKGVNCFTKTHWLEVHPSVPLGVYVSQDSGYPLNVTHAQFKMTLFPKG